MNERNKSLTCDNCTFEFPEDNDFCPQCGIPAKKENKADEVFFICPVCEAKNLIGERKCAFCCSLIHSN